MKIYLTDDIYIKPCPACPSVWDVTRCFKTKRKGSKLKSYEITLANGVNFEHLLRIIPNCEISMSENETMTLEEYINEYKRIQDNVILKLKEILNKH